MSFIAGVAVAAGFLMPQITTPDYKRGHEDGFKEGYASAEISWVASIEDARRDERKKALAECAGH